MLSPLILSLISAFGVALLSVVGVLTFAVKDKVLGKILLFFVSFSAGALLGGAFFHLLPEAVEEAVLPPKVFIYAIVGIGLFFILERVLRWRHCHHSHCETHHIGQISLVGDALHNFLDGIILISAFSVNSSLGLAVFLAVALHEVPQEIGDFGVLLYAGFKKMKALAYNFASALAIIPGVLAGYFLLQRIENISSILLPLAAGGFIYIAMSDLIPEIHKEKSVKKSLFSFAVFVAAVILMLLLAH